MTLLEIAQNILNGHKFEISSARGFLGIKKGTNIKLKEQIVQGLFSELFDKTCEVIGSPIYVHSFYGYIWEMNGEFLTYNAIEENYNYEVINFFIFNRLPCEKKLSYREYTQTVETVKQVFEKHNLNVNIDNNYHNKTFCFLSENSEILCLISIKKRSLFFAYSQKEPLEDGTVKIKPCYTRKKKILLSNPTKMKSVLESCFINE